jgi:hypothetical protein
VGRSGNSHPPRKFASSVTTQSQAVMSSGEGRYDSLGRRGAQASTACLPASLTVLTISAKSLSPETSTAVSYSVAVCLPQHVYGELHVHAPCWWYLANSACCVRTMTTFLADTFVRPMSLLHTPPAMCNLRKSPIWRGCECHSRVCATCSHGHVAQCLLRTVRLLHRRALTQPVLGRCHVLPSPGYLIHLPSPNLATCRELVSQAINSVSPPAPLRGRERPR